MTSTGHDEIYLPSRIVAEIIAHARREQPAECCGLLAGDPPRVQAIFPLENELRSGTRYQAAPRSLIDAFRSMRAASLELVAIYHSHPSSTAKPSATDLAENHYGPVPHLIVSLLTDPPDIRAYRLGENHYDELRIRVEQT